MANEANPYGYEGWERRNAIVPLTLDAITDLLQPAYPGARATGAVPAHGGFGNTVYRVEVAGREEAVALRLCQRDPDASEREVHLWRLIRERVPMPEVFHGSATGGPNGMAWNLSAWVEAEPADAALRRADESEAAALACAAGATLAGLSAFTFPQAGFFGRDLDTMHPFPGGLVDGYLAHLEDLLFRQTAGRLLGEDFARRAWDFATDSRAAMEPIRDARTLVHSDYRTGNLLVRRDGRDWTVAALIDWDFVHAGSPLFDIAVLLRHHQSDAFEEAFLRGFVEHGGILPDSWRRIARVLDLVGLCDILNGAAERPAVIRDLTGLIRAAVQP